MLKRFINTLFIFAFLIAGLGVAAQAALPDYTPGNCLLNPVTETLYIINNSVPEIKIYNHLAGQGWEDSNHEIGDFPVKSKIYGMAANAAGDRLYVSVNAGASSDVRIYELDNGTPKDYTSMDMTGSAWVSLHSPACLAISADGNYLYLTDKYLGLIRIFDISNDANAWVKDVSYSNSDPHYGIAVTTDKVFVSNKGSAGRILVYAGSGENITYDHSFSTGNLSYPTNIEVHGDKLYVAVNSANGVDILRYDVATEGVDGRVRSGLTGTYDWTTFNVRNNLLIFKRTGPSANRLFRISTGDIADPCDATEIEINIPVPPHEIIDSDGLVLSFDTSKAALTNSPDGRVQQLPTEGTGESTITDIQITIDGSDIVISWTDQTGNGVDVHELVCDTDAAGNYDSYFTTATADWNQIETAIQSPYSIPNLVGEGKARYYKLVPTGDPLESSDLTTDVVGKFDIAVDPPETEPDNFFISVPLDTADNSVTSLIGSQVNEMDMIVVFDIDKNVIQGSMYQGGNWVLFPGAQGTVDNLEAGMTYGYITAASRFITVVGMVRETNLSRDLAGGAPLAANWLANPYPSPIDIANAGLNTSSHDAMPGIGSTVYRFNADALPIPTTEDGMAFHTAETEWTNGSVSGPSAMQLIPGRGYMFTEPTIDPYTWDLIRPY
jgi:hypothetical protein